MLPGRGPSFPNSLGTSLGKRKTCQHSFLFLISFYLFLVMMKPPLFVGLDVGGSTMKAGVVDDLGQPFSTVSLPTEAFRGQEKSLERMCETIRFAIATAGLRA